MNDYDVQWKAAADFMEVQPNQLILINRLWETSDGRFVGIEVEEGIPRVFVPRRIPCPDSCPIRKEQYEKINTVHSEPCKNGKEDAENILSPAKSPQ